LTTEQNLSIQELQRVALKPKPRDFSKVPLCSTFEKSLGLG
jgi:hypothetical protein